MKTKEIISNKPKRKIKEKENPKAMINTKTSAKAQNQTK